MAHSALVQLCRFCGGQNDVIVDLLETGLGDKLTKYFPLKFEVADLLPKMACAECASTIQQMEGFVLKAQEVERDLLERTSRPAHNNVMTPSEIRSLAQSMTTKLSTPKTASVGDVLRKLNTSSIVIKKVDKVVPKYEPPMVQIKKQPIDEEPLLKMKVEVLDEELEHLPSDNFVHYDDTDDDDDEGEVLARKSFRSIESVNIKEMHSTDESSQDVYAEERLEIEMDPDYVEEKKVITKRRRRRNSIWIQPEGLYGTKSFTADSADPCNYVCVTCKGNFSSFDKLKTHIDKSKDCNKINRTCDTCEKVFDTRRAMFQHRLSHQPRPQLTCERCGKTYTNVHNVQAEEDSPDGDVGYVCCEQRFTSRRDLDDHITKHSRISNMLCDNCGNLFASHKSYRPNVKSYACELCDEIFDTKFLLMQHSRVHAPPPKVKPRKPSPVKAKPKRAYSTQSVVISLTDPCNYVCVTCKGKFSSFEQLQAHIDESIACKKVNTTCDQCGKICDTRRALYQHKLSHQPKPQLICDQCGKIYTNSFNLENHKSQVHGEEFEELGYVYKCCELTFPTRRELNEHIKTHSKILNLLCDTCGKSFTSHKALRSHTQSHLNIRPFSCDLCDKAFRTKLLLVQHSHVHTGIKAFKCDVCEKSFAKKDSLRKHYKMHSNEPVSWSSTGEKISVKPMDQLQGEEEEHLQPIHPYVEFATGMQETM
ncbi:zinc finger protein 287-like isoform X1 [Armigeres subalbatus]|uniref:zinc finger protein 287-like isoform X1 n=1 Tax=Armigeres subalbatus TaxID=124917 RepID=UPI002ED3096B